MLNVENLQLFRDYLNTLHDADIENVEFEDDSSSFTFIKKIKKSGFNMRFWTDDCGTPCCIGGHLCAFFNLEDMEYGKVAIHMFNLSSSNCRWLFTPPDYETKKLSEALSAIDFLIENPNENSYDERIWNTEKQKVRRYHAP